MPMIDKAESVVLLAGTSKEQFPTVTRRPQMNAQRRLHAHCANIEVVEFLPRSGATRQVFAEMDCPVLFAQ
jgi:hypothetical protein